MPVCDCQELGCRVSGCPVHDPGPAPVEDEDSYIGALRAMNPEQRERVWREIAAEIERDRRRKRMKYLEDFAREHPKVALALATILGFLAEALTNASGQVPGA